MMAGHKKGGCKAILVSAGKIFLMQKTPVLQGISAISLDVARLLKERLKIAIDNTKRICEYGPIKAAIGAAETQARKGGKGDMNINEIMKQLGDTDGRDGSTWDPEVLREAASACAAGQMPEDFSGRPEMADECARFCAAWREVQRTEP